MSLAKELIDEVSNLVSFDGYLERISDPQVLDKIELAILHKKRDIALQNLIDEDNLDNLIERLEKFDETQANVKAKLKNIFRDFLEPFDNNKFFKCCHYGATSLISTFDRFLDKACYQYGGTFIDIYHRNSNEIAMYMYQHCKYIYPRM
jgi:hypothetical protein